MSREKPILFSTPIVQAILAGRKTMTRRVIKPQPTFVNSEYGYTIHETPEKPFKELNCPYGQGDILWVRETWSQLDMDYKAVTGKLDIEDFKGCPIVYKADGTAPEHFNYWRPSIFMPRSAARIFLKVTNVRVERLQDITAEDAMAEGIKLNCRHDDYVCSAHPCDFKTTFACKDYFKELWDNLNSKRGYGWELNPWVWVIEFERVNDYDRS